VRGALPPDRLDFGALTASGTARFTNGRISAKALPQMLTNVNGTVLFERDRIRIAEPLVAQLGEANGSDGQRVSVAGVLPLQYQLSSTDPDAARPLTLDLNDLALELANLYDGRVNGRVLITGAAFAPILGGTITLSNGRIIIPTQQANVPTAATPAAQSAEPNNLARGNGVISPPEYDALQVTLGERLRVTYDPVLSFLVQGNLLVSGTQPDPLLDGVVRLRSGQVNLFTTQFNLDRGYRNTAVFSSNQGLDPTLDVQLVTSVPEVTRFPDQTYSPFPVSEIVDDASAGDFGAIQTVRVQANVAGPASQVFENLELTSSPRRTETEILALLGGGLIGGDATTALASIVGSPLLTELQNLINDTLGITDFRLFPTTIISEDRATSLALATELGVDITDDLSVSILQLLTVRELPQFSLRYRLNDQLLLRGSTNFSNESRAVLEFETRF
jgi:translocation and assembly module TamB